MDLVCLQAQFRKWKCPKSSSEFMRFNILPMCLIINEMKIQQNPPKIKEKNYELYVHTNENEVVGEREIVDQTED